MDNGKLNSIMYKKTFLKIFQEGFFMDKFIALLSNNKSIINKKAKSETRIWLFLLIIFR